MKASNVRNCLGYSASRFHDLITFSSHLWNPRRECFVLQRVAFAGPLA
ncbi:MAG: hypothetical protein OJF48_001720 [Afipia sp.]|nr:MAG: hypothetical protein OJF48_001720 [Afipia sp.]